MSGEYDVIFHWGELHLWLGKDWKNFFSRDTEEITMPRGASRNFAAYKAAITAKYGNRPIHQALTNKGWSRSGIRIAVVGFSETCIGAAVLLGSPDGGSIDFIYANDGIHGSLPLWKQYASLAAFGTSDNSNLAPTERSLVITHSHTASPGKNIPSTAESAHTIATSVMASPVPTKFVDIPELKDTAHDPPVRVKCSWSKEVVNYDKVPGMYTTNVGNLWIFGYTNVGKTCTDHIYQSKVIGPRVLKHILAPRWNDNPRSSGSCVVV